MQEIKSIYDGVNFMPKQPIPVKGQYKVVITFVEPLDKAESVPESKKRPFSEMFGEWSDKIQMSDDFDEPLLTADENIQKYDVPWLW